MPENPDTRPLPDGWVEQFDDQRQRWFYKQTSVTPPRISYAHPRGALKPSERTPPILNVRGLSQAAPSPSPLSSSSSSSPSPLPSSPAAAMYRNVPTSPIVGPGASSPSTNLPAHMRRVFSTPQTPLSPVAASPPPGYPTDHTLPPLPPRSPVHRRFSTSTNGAPATPPHERPLFVQHFVRRPPRTQTLALPYIAPPPERITSFDPVPQVRLSSTDLYHVGPATLGAGYVTEQFELPSPHPHGAPQSHQATQHPIPGYQPTSYDLPPHQPSTYQPTSYDLPPHQHQHQHQHSAYQPTSYDPPTHQVQQSTSHPPHQSTSSLGPPQSTTPPAPYQLEAPPGSTAYQPQAPLASHSAYQPEPTSYQPTPPHIDIGVQAFPKLDDTYEVQSSVSSYDADADGGGGGGGGGDYQDSEEVGLEFDYSGGDVSITLDVPAESGSTAFGVLSALIGQMQGGGGTADGAPPYDPGF